jgi:stearoyl-CoA desaturase (Delta-9 desaturase)
LHRCQAHRGVEFHPVLSTCHAFWLWLTTGMTTKQWVAVHRKHHQTTDVEGDPHSPHVFGIKNSNDHRLVLVQQASKDANFVMQYGVGTPKDWIERRLYTPHHKLGILAMLAIDLALFGAWGLLVWGIQMIWIPFWAAGMINGLAHWWGYRNGETRSQSQHQSHVASLLWAEKNCTTIIT